jgi:1-acyl-sn-glycerol-3-phosphate acyltransferase
MLIDGGWSILIYPEGTRTQTGAMDSFRPGLGLLAVSLNVPVVPVYTAGLYNVLPKGKSIPRPGKAATFFGEPLIFTEKTHFREATQRIEDAVRSLATLANLGEGI